MELGSWKFDEPVLCPGCNEREHPLIFSKSTGLRLERKKDASLLNWNLKRPSPPEKIRVPIPSTSLPCVRVGDIVQIGQKIAVPIPINRSVAEIGAVQVPIQKKEIKTWTEEIRDEAIKCKHCGEFLGELPKVSPVPKTPWYARTATLVISFLTVGPFALPLVWINPVYSRRKKIIVTVIVLAVTYAFVVVFLNAVKTILDYYKQVAIF